MRSLRRNPRTVEAKTFRPNRLFLERDRLRKDIETVEIAAKLRTKAETSDPYKFLLDYCKLKPYKHTLEIAKLYFQHQFLAVCLPRQTGKSTTIGALILQDAWEHNNLTSDLWA